MSKGYGGIKIYAHNISARSSWLNFDMKGEESGRDGRGDRCEGETYGTMDGRISL